MLFATALNRSNRSDLVYISIGCDIKNGLRRTQKLFTQQLPNEAVAASTAGLQVSIILIDVKWRNGYPTIFDAVEGSFKNRSQDTFYVFTESTSSITIRTITGFFTPDNETELCNFVRHRSPNQRVLLGDFTVTGPFSPLENFPKLRACQFANMQYMGNETLDLVIDADEFNARF